MGVCGSMWGICGQVWELWDSIGKHMDGGDCGSKRGSGYMWVNKRNKEMCLGKSVKTGECEWVGGGTW